MKDAKQVQSTAQILQEYRTRLAESERSAPTGKLYLREANAFLHYLTTTRPGAALPALSRQDVLSYKNALIHANYAPATINTRLVATNTFLKSLGCAELTVCLLRRQRQPFCDPDRLLSKEDYRRLISAASRAADPRVLPILVTLCSCGIRVSELPYITVEALHAGRATIRNKGKYRTILLPQTLCTFLEGFCSEWNIATGPLFRSRTDRPLERTQIWRMLKALAASAQIAPEKVYPHNLRHLFARTFYTQEKDLVALADILGHSNINTTRLYVLNTGDEHRAKLDAMGLVPAEAQQQKKHFVANQKQQRRKQ